MAAENIRHWKIGDVDVARIVEVNNWEDDIAMLLPDGKPEYVQRFPWLVPQFATPRRPDAHLLSMLRAQVTRQVRDDRHLHRQRPAARIPRVLQHADDVSRGPGGRRVPARWHRHRDVFAPALRPRGVEHPQGRRKVGTDLPAGALSLWQELELAVDDVEQRVRAPLRLVGHPAASRRAAAPLVGEDDLGAVVVERRRSPAMVERSPSNSASVAGQGYPTGEYTLFVRSCVVSPSILFALLSSSPQAGHPELAKGLFRGILTKMMRTFARFPLRREHLC